MKLIDADQNSIFFFFKKESPFPLLKCLIKDKDDF